MKQIEKIDKSKVSSIRARADGTVKKSVIDFLAMQPIIATQRDITEALNKTRDAKHQIREQHVNNILNKELKRGNVSRINYQGKDSLGKDKMLLHYYHKTNEAAVQKAIKAKK